MNNKFKISGMTCSACANRIEKVVSKMEGVKDANVNFATETLTVNYDDKAITKLDIEEKVEKIGFKIQKNIQSHNYKIEGMTCSACANRVEKVTKKMSGVENAVVNFATEKLSISYDADVINFGDIKAKVEKAGYKLIREDEQKVEEKRKKLDEKGKLFWRLILSLIFAVPLLTITMGHMVGMPLPNIMDPMMNPLNFAIIQLVLTIPVMIIGYKFYYIGYKNLFIINTLIY